MDLKDIKGIGEKTEKKLNQLGVFCQQDLLYFLPKKYIDLNNPTDINKMSSGSFYLIEAKVVKINKSFSKNKLSIFSIRVEDKTNKLKIIWFNQNYIMHQIEIDKNYKFYGKVNINNGNIKMVNPECEEIDKLKKLQGIRVVYPTKQLSNNKINEFVNCAINNIQIKSIINKDILEKYNLKSIDSVIKDLHCPKNIENLNEKINRILIENTVNLLAIYDNLVKYKLNERKFFYDLSFNIIDDVAKCLPFKLTDSQIEAINEILNDFKSNKNMNRLLLGDVGSGKTIVAILAIYYVIKNGGKAVVMVPTESLALQHFESFKILEQFGINIGLLIGSNSVKNKNTLIEKINNNYYNVVIGTQSLLSDNINLESFTFTILDEQQKFGVNEKSKIILKTKNKDVLSMSATPIPRAVFLLLTNELDISIIYKRNQENFVTTKLVNDNKINDMFCYLVKKAEEKEQIYIICSRIESDELYSSHSIYYELKNKYTQINIAELTSKTNEEDKKKILNDFSKNKIQILISTTIIEVGIDNPNATIMVILNSERYGLATLHQLRGRVGRGNKKSYCFLHYQNLNEKSIQRLKTLKEYNDGFKISKIDWQMRGGGDFLGVNQSGKTNDIVTCALINEDIIKISKDIFNDVKKTNYNLNCIYNVKEYNKILKDIVLA